MNDMFYYRFIAIVLSVGWLLFATNEVEGQSESESITENEPDSVAVQFIHASSDTAAAELDLYLSDDPLAAVSPSEEDLHLSEMAYKEVTELHNVPEDHEYFFITPAGSDEVLYSRDLNFWDDEETYIIHGDTEDTDRNIRASRRELQTEGSEPEELDLKAFHAVLDGPDEMDMIIRNDDNTHLSTLNDIGYGSSSGQYYFGYGEGLYTFELFESGADINDDTPLKAYSFEVDPTEHGGRAAFAIATGHLAGADDDKLPGVELMFVYPDGERYFPAEEEVTSTGESVADEVPAGVKLEDNYPNPFNPQTEIVYNLPSEKHVELSIYDQLGRHVATLVNQEMQEGRHEVSFDASELASGTYIYRLEAGEVVRSKQMTLIK